MNNISLQTVPLPQTVGTFPAPPAPSARSETIASTSDPSNNIYDRVSISTKGINAASANKPANNSSTNSSATSSENSPTSKHSAHPQELDSADLLEVTKLKRRDAEVKKHEQAHLSAAGQHAAGGPSFTYQVGPDGMRYAVGGEVPIDMSKESTPEETIQKMQIVARAALAPASPSTADRRIAARAAAIEAQARNEIQNETLKSSRNDSSQNERSGSNNTLSPGESVVSGNQDNLSPASNLSISSNTRQRIVNTYQSQAV